MIPPIWLKFVIKSFDDEIKTELIATPNTEKTIEKPKTKNIVFNTTLVLFIKSVPDLVDFVKYSTDILNKHLIVVGLNGDSDRKNFGEIKDIYPLADKITLLTALCLSCKDGTEAIFSKKITNKKEQIDVGNEDTYIPVCRKCYNNNLSTL